MKLSTHGSYTIEIQDNILVIDARGPFNDKIAEQYQLEMIDVTNQLAGSPWVSLVTYYGNGIFTPEAEHILVDVTKYRMKHGMIANASVILESVHADLQQMQLRRVYNTCNLPFHVFSDVDSAKAWLNDFVAQQKAAM